ncbi:hypothetical protein Tco_0194499 [Tanacetum coccineum]
MEYLPKRTWSTLEKKRANIMIKAIDKQLKEKKLMRSLEKVSDEHQVMEDQDDVHEACWPHKLCPYGGGVLEMSKLWILRGFEFWNNSAGAQFWDALKAEYAADIGKQCRISLFVVFC